MSKNPNQEQGIIVTVTKQAWVKIPMPCVRLNRRLHEFLTAAKVRHTEYKFVLQETGAFPAGKRPAVGISTKPGSTIHFEINVNLPDGEFFKCSLTAPVKCGDDNLTYIFAGTATQISSHGWHIEKPAEQKGIKLPTITPQQVKKEMLAREIEAWLKKADIEEAGCHRSIQNMNKMIAELQERKGAFKQHLLHLRL